VYLLQGILEIPVMFPATDSRACYAAAAAVYFVQGILGLSRLALSFFFKDDLGVEPAQVRNKHNNLLQFEHNKQHNTCHQIMCAW
jgi:hypothetical protein